MNCASCEEHIRDFYGFAVAAGFAEDSFLSAANKERYIATSIDAYRDYPLFLHTFGKSYDEKTFRRMMTVDLKSRMHGLAGISAGGDFESVMLIEPPGAKKVGMPQYVRVARPGDYTLLFKPAMYRLEDYEKYAGEKRKNWLDDTTWYIYVFATRKAAQRQGYGRKLMNLMLSYADRRDRRICLETNLADNVSMYGRFGFVSVSSSMYRDALEHYVMLYPGEEKRQP
ncbi:MAG: GNAT family N-acetyltransferase [Lachnospiraceae bacterium]|nr:GNAT family N-acetyltransferase [Lachnospiraceae bacterium]